MDGIERVDDVRPVMSLIARGGPVRSPRRRREGRHNRADGPR